MAGTTAENSFLQFIDLIMLVLTLAVLVAFLYFAFNVLHVRVPPSVNGILNMVGDKAKDLGDVPRRVDILKLI